MDLDANKPELLTDLDHNAWGWSEPHEPVDPPVNRPVQPLHHHI